MRTAAQRRLATRWSFRIGLFAFWIAAFAVSIIPNVYAHKPSDSYLSLQVDNTTTIGQWDIALRDLEYAIGLDANNDGAITWGELRARQKAVEDYALSRLHLRLADSVGRMRVTELLVDNHTDGAYAVLRFTVDGGSSPKTIEITYRALFDIDPQHRGLLRLVAHGQTQTAVFSPDNATQRFELGTPDGGKQFLSFAWEGIWHIWIGFDHILFLIALLLPAVLRRENVRWRGVDGFAPAFANVFKIVTAFTLAHSITLSLATLGIVRLPSRWVESAIAASVVLAALNNIYPFFHGRGWLVAFGFGLVHGFGFANVLLDLGLEKGALARALVGFNLGVEAGQLAIVGVFLPLAYGLRATWFYQRLTLKFGSLCVALIASSWMLERMFGFRVLPF
ncbi:MAG: HupE/UreJ family protein [Verrucomicrobiota bacterium]